MLDALIGDAAIAPWFSDEADIAAMLRFEAALAAAQAACGLIPVTAAAAIAEACDGFEVDHNALRVGMAADGVLGPAFVAALRERVDPPHRAWVHFQATSQDAVDTSLVLRLAAVVGDLGARLERVIAWLEELRRVHGRVILMGHTRMQRALPITAADKVDAWRAPLERHARRLVELTPRLLVVQLGGPVGTRGGLDGQGDAVADGLATRLGLHPAPCWHTARDGIAEFGFWLALVAGSLGKIGQDIALLSQNEIGAVRLSGGGRSSAMAHKSNPVAAEALVALARFAAGQAGTLAQALVHENERSGAAWTLEWMLLPGLCIATGAALRHAEAILADLRFTDGDAA